MRALVRVSIWLKRTVLRVTALYSFTGMLTRPKLIDPLQMARGMADQLPATAQHSTQWHNTVANAAAIDGPPLTLSSYEPAAARATRSVPKAVRMAR